VTICVPYRAMLTITEGGGAAAYHDLAHSTTEVLRLLAARAKLHCYAPQRGRQRRGLQRPWRPMLGRRQSARRHTAAYGWTGR